MGCSGSKKLALDEINQLIQHITQENAQLERERDKLKNQRANDRNDEERSVLSDFKSMHQEFARELAELKDQMSLLCQSEDSNENVVSAKNGIQKVIEIQEALECKSTQIRDILLRRDELKVEQANYETLIQEMEKNIMEIDSALRVQQETLAGQENIEEKIARLQKEKTKLIDELKEAEETYKDLREDVKDWDFEDESATSDMNSFERLLNMSEAEIKKEIIAVDKELNQLSSKIKDLEVREAELQKTDEYLTEMSGRLAANGSTFRVKEQIKEAKDKVEELRTEKRKVKAEIIKLRKAAEGDEDRRKEVDS